MWLDIVVLVFNPFHKESVCLPALTIRLFGLLSNSIEVATLSLNAIFEVFSEDTYDAAFIQQDCLKQLSKFSLTYKQMIRKRVRDRAFLLETSLNLSRFIAYKRTHCQN